MEDEEYSMIFKMILIGDSGVGKTNILNRYINNTFSETTKSTVGVELGTKVEEYNNTKIKVQIWDTAGQERYKSITKTYYKGAKGAFIVYDITKKDSFKNIDKWIQDLREFGEDDAAILIVGNKSDLEESREVTTDEVKKKAEVYKMAYCETSALKSKNINYAFQTLIKLVAEKMENKKNEENKYGNQSNVISTGVSLETKIIAADNRPKNKNGYCC
jgi:small GTP-binding protein